MKITTIAAAITALALGSSNLAFAQGANDNGPDHSRGPGQQARDVRPRDVQPHRGGPSYRPAPAPNSRYRPGPPDRRMGDRRGAGPDHNFYRGGRLPPQYRSRQYVVDDWRGHHLNAPPRGYHWVQTGGDYVLVAVATGIIASILLNQ
ncbi:MAG: RcnB family protein [Caldimonas sp.]